MTKTTDTAITIDWIKETGIQWTVSKNNPLEDYTLLKVYNPNMGTTPDADKDWYILQLWAEWWEIFDTTLNDIKVLEIVKSYKWYAPKLINWKPELDDSWKAITEVYYTPEVSVYDKWNIALAKSTENGPVVLGKGGFNSYIEFTTSMQLPDGKLNPLFSTIGTNSQTGEKYPISSMRQEYSMYFEMDWKLYKIRLWASYWKWKDIVEGTFLHAKELWMKKFKETYWTMRFEFYYLNLNAVVKKADKYRYLEWTFKDITKDSVIDLVNKTKEVITNMNNQNFPWISLSNWMETLPYDMNRLILTAWTTEPIINAETEISIDDIPF
jgi:hypothetical protein